MKRDEYIKIARALGLISYLGLVMAANIGVGFAGGYLLDLFLGREIIKIAGLFLGVISGFYSVYKLIMNIVGDDNVE